MEYANRKMQMKTSPRTDYDPIDCVEKECRWPIDFYRFVIM